MCIVHCALCIQILSEMFWKKHTEPLPIAVGAAEVQSDETKPLTMEEKARQWFAENTGKTMPEEFKTWLRALAHDEAVRVTTQTYVLDGGQIMRMHEARRLAMTKLENVEQSLLQVSQKQDWIKRFTEVSMRLDDCQKVLYTAGKQNAASANLRTELELYDQLEDIKAVFHQHNIMQQQLQQVRDNAYALQQQATEAEQRAFTASTDAATAAKQHADAQNNLKQAMDTITEAFKLDGIADTLERGLHETETRLKEEQNNLDALRLEVTSTEATLRDKEVELADTRARLQAFEPHTAMLKNGGAIMVRLDQMFEIDRRREVLRRQAETDSTRQRDLSNRLARLFEQDQALHTDLGLLHGEVQMHRQHNHTIDGTRLQARTIELKTRRQRLIMARADWTHIYSLYRHINEKRQALDRLQITIAHDADDIETLASRVRMLQASTEQKRYTFTVGKSQNVISLRADLRVGIQFPVCGALNHPYHCESAPEQNKLMGDWKNEVELLDLELRNMTEQLAALQMKHATEQGQYAAGQETVRAMQEEYANVTRGWGQYADLDTSLADCDPAVWGDMRFTMLERLIDDTDRQASEAQKELDTFNYHQLAINRLAEQIDDKDNQRTELAEALNEINTACQVMAGSVERTQGRIDALSNDYAAIMREMEKEISISDWQQSWRDGHEKFKQELHRRMDSRSECIRLEAEQRVIVGVLRERLVNLRRLEAEAEKRQLAIQHEMERTSTRSKEVANNYARLLGSAHAVETYNRALQQVDAAAREMEQRREEHIKRLSDHQSLAGQTKVALANTDCLDAKVIDLRAQIDEWIRTYNATHAPMHYAELEKVLHSDRDWMKCRSDLHDTQMRYLLAETHEQDVRSMMLGLQADENRAKDTESDTIEGLIAARDTLEKQRSEIMYQIAEIDQKLAWHERAVKQLSNA